MLQKHLFLVVLGMSNGSIDECSCTEREIVKVSLNCEELFTDCTDFHQITRFGIHDYVCRGA